MTIEPAITLAILDDHPILLSALAEWIRRSGPDIRVATAVGTWPELLGADRPGTLTHREREIVRLFVDGMPLKQVATLLGITQDAARSSLRSARGKYRAEGLAVGTKISLRRQALRDGIVER